MVKRNFIPYLHLLMKKMISKITKRVFKEAIDFLFIRPILKSKKFNAADSIILFSEARGGSTWLMEMLRETLNVCINWEPLHVNSGVVPKENKLGWRPFIPKDNIDDSYNITRDHLQTLIHGIINALVRFTKPFISYT